MSGGNQCLTLCRLSSNLVSFNYRVANLLFGVLSGESCSVSSQGTSSHLPAHIDQEPRNRSGLTRLPWLMVNVKFQFTCVRK